MAKTTIKTYLIVLIVFAIVAAIHTMIWELDAPLRAAGIAH